jgi:hypothetical protein
MENTLQGMNVSCNLLQEYQSEISLIKVTLYMSHICISQHITSVRSKFTEYCDKHYLLHDP